MTIGSGDSRGSYVFLSVGAAEGRLTATEHKVTDQDLDEASDRALAALEAKIADVSINEPVGPR